MLIAFSLNANSFLSSESLAYLFLFFPLRFFFLFLFSIPSWSHLKQHHPPGASSFFLLRFRATHFSFRFLAPLGLELAQITTIADLGVQILIFG
jgi:hypothetical protein